MLYVMTFFWCLPSPLVWIMNAEVWVIGHSLKGIDFPWLMALIAVAGQTCCFVFLFFFGEVVLRRIPKLRARIERFDVARYRSWSYAALGLGSILGLPPHVLLAMLAKTLHYRFLPFLWITIVGRVARFMVLAYAPSSFAQLFGAS